MMNKKNKHLVKISFIKKQKIRHKIYSVQALKNKS